MNDDQSEVKTRFQSIFEADGITPNVPALGRSQPLSWGLRMVLYMLSGLRVGRLHIVLPNGESRRLIGQAPGPLGVLHIHDERLVRHVLSAGEVGFGEAYMAGCWDSPDIATLLEVLYLNERYVRGPYEKNPLTRLWGLLLHRARSNTRDGASTNIEHHYDLGNDFYKLWLDPTMAYSSAVFETPGQSLEQAQVNKYRLICERLQLAPSHHLLEIGSGWGGFAIYAARETGCRVTSITLSKEQLAEAQRRAVAAGVGDRVHFQIRDYRDVTDQFDRVVSIEMYEAVGEDFWPEYFQTIARALRPGGLAVIQGITIDAGIFEQYRTKRDFLQKYIFPGGMLCPPELFRDHASRQGLVPEDVGFFADDYAQTLARWHVAVLASRTAIVHTFDERFLRMWRYYLAYCECGFRTGSVNLMQITLRKPA